jgi:ubiquinol-cytochrome c reductase cytochrome c1 subunit
MDTSTMFPKRALLALVLAFAAGTVGASAAGGKVGNDESHYDLENTKSLQRGAKYFVNYCLGCHSLNYVRYQRLGQDLGISDAQIDDLLFTADKPTEMMRIAMPAADAERWFGRTPPDLSLTARARGGDWIFNYLRTFYVDPKRPFGVNNVNLPGASMPHVLAELQGYQRAVYKLEAAVGGGEHEVLDRLEPITPGKLSAAEYDGVARDLANFLVYVSEPAQLQRMHLGFGVLFFLAVFFLLAYFLKREFWKDVH